MQIVKTVKGRIIVGSLLAVLLLGTTYAFANTNIGEQLKAWYQALFEQKSEEIFAKLDEEIEETRDEVTTTALSNIERAKLQHLQNLDEAKEEILRNVEYDFYQVYLVGYREIRRVADEGLQQAENGLKAHTNAVGQAAQNYIIQELTQAREQAVQELEEAIEQAKTEIRAEVERYVDVVNSNLLNDLERIYENVFAEIEQIKERLVAEQQSILANVAAELEAEALAAMDEVIRNLGND